MTAQRAALTIAIVLGATAIHAGQTNRIGKPASADATSADVLVMQQVDPTTGQAYGTMPVSWVVEARRRLADVADLAVVGWAGSAPRLSKDLAGGPAMSTAEATFNTLSVLGIRPALGRDFTEADVLGNRRVAIPAAGPWQRHFASRADVVGSTVWRTPENSRPEPVEIVGVLPPGVLTATPELDSLTEALLLIDHRFPGAGPSERSPAGIIRLRPGVPLSTAQRLIDESVDASRSHQAETHRILGARLFSLRVK
jgi:hypothetical protein